jgi:hypothetical protein
MAFGRFPSFRGVRCGPTRLCLSRWREGGRGDLTRGTFQDPGFTPSRPSNLLHRSATLHLLQNRSDPNQGARASDLQEATAPVSVGLFVRALFAGTAGSLSGLSGGPCGERSRSAAFAGGYRVVRDRMLAWTATDDRLRSSLGSAARRVVASRLCPFRCEFLGEPGVKRIVWLRSPI